MAKISTRRLTSLPDIDALQRLLQSLAMLDAIVQPEWEYRYYSFNAKWGKGTQMGSMRDGCGDDFFAHFSRHGCWIKGFAHEASMTPYNREPKSVWPGVLDSVPKEFASCFKEPAFSLEDTTFCIWRLRSDDKWQRGAIKFPDKYDADGSEGLLSMLDGKPKTYKSWADDYYEDDDGPRDFPLASIRAIYEHAGLTDDLVRSLNPERTRKSVLKDAQEIGYV